MIRGTMKGAAMVLAMGAAMVWSESADARGSYPATIPTPFSCSTCHFNPGGGGSRNNFGDDYRNNGRNWAGICNLDSDGDGFTNGQEFGDPNCEWTQGDPRPMFDATRPGDDSDVPDIGDPICGDGVVNGDDECDGDDLGGNACSGNGFDGGTVSCNPDCTLNTDACTTCGDNLAEGDEACDGTDVGTADCLSEGFVGGTLGCNETCSGFDTSQCEADPDNVCGDDVRANEEQCDGADFGGESCESLGFDGGTLGCFAVECTFDTSACVAACGNGVIDDGEECDGDNLGAVECSELVPMSEGTVTCNDDCSFNIEECTVVEDPEPTMMPDMNPEMMPDMEPDMEPETMEPEATPPPSTPANDDDCSVGSGPAGSSAYFLFALLGIIGIWRRRK